MIPFWKSRNLTINDFLLTTPEATSSRNLSHALVIIHKHRKRLRSFRSKSSDHVFSALLHLSHTNEKMIEAELLKHNTPPPLDEPIAPEQELWASISSIIFRMNSVFSNTFIKTLVERCLLRPTNLAFGLVHSDSIALLVKKNPKPVSPTLVEIVISSTDDSRSIYALKVARWLPEWSDVADAALTAMTFAGPPKQIEAMWLVNERGSVNEVTNFLRKNDIDLKASGRASTDIRLFTKTVVKSRRSAPCEGIEYVVGPAAKRMSSEELKMLSNRIRKLLKGENHPN